MRILILSQWYRPEPDLKVHLLARDLVARGHIVTVITGIPNYPTGKVYDGYHVRPWPQTETMDGVRVVRVPLYPDHSRSSAKRVLNYASFALSAAFWGLLWAKKADVMWVYHPPLTVAIPACVISMIRRLPFVYEIADMWPETLAATGMIRSAGLLRAIGGLARFVYGRADWLTVVSPGFKANLLKKGVPEDKIEVLPNWADEDVYRPLPPDPGLARQLGLEGKFNIFYAGNIGLAQGLGNLLDAAARLRDIPTLQFVLAGDGLEEERLRRRTEQENLTNVRFLGRILPNQIAALAANSQVLLVHLRRDPLFEITIPAKTSSCLACGRPVLTVSAGDAANVVTQAKAGLVCPPEDPQALADSVRVLYNMPSEKREGLGRRAREHFLRHFTRASLVPRYEELLSRATERARR